MPILDASALSERADPLIEKILSILGDPNVEALGDAMEQAGRGAVNMPHPAAKGLGLGMVWGGKTLANLDTKQLNKFLKHLKKLRTTRGFGAAPRNVSPETSAALAYSQARRTPAARGMRKIYGPMQTKGAQGEFFPNLDYQPKDDLAEYGTRYRGDMSVKPMEDKDVLRILGASGSQTPLSSNVGTAGHELAHGGYHHRKVSKGDPGWHERELKLPYSKRPHEIQAHRMGNVAEKDFERFMEAINDPKVYDSLDPEAKKVADSYRQMYRLSAERRLQQYGISDMPKGATRRGQEEAWQMLSPTQQSQQDLLRAEAKPRAAALLSKDPAGSWGRGSFIDITGKETKLKPDQEHGTVLRSLKRAGKETRGFELRAGNVHMPDASYLNHKEGLTKAMERAYQYDWLRNGRYTDVLVQAGDLGYVEVPYGDRGEFLSNPVKYIKMAQILNR